MPRARDPANLVDALAAAAPLATRWMERLLAANDPPLTVAQYLALAAVRRELLTGAELARRAGVSGAAVSQLVAGLERAGWVTRARQTDDRRRQALALTPLGERALDQATDLLRARLGRLLAGLPRPEADALARLLGRLEERLAGSPPPRRPPPRPPRAPEARRHGRR